MHALTPISYPGTLILGVGDSFASIVGSRIGSVRWLAHSKKTVEGTIAAYLSVKAVSYIISFFGIFPMSAMDLKFEVATVCVAVFEGVLTQIDNLFLPILYCILLL